MAQLESGLPSVPVASLVPDVGHNMKPKQHPASARQRRFAFDFDERYLSRVLRDYKAEQEAEAPGQQPQSAEPNWECTPNLDVTPEDGSDGQQPVGGFSQQVSEHPGASPASRSNLSPSPPMHELEQVGGQIPVIPPTVATPCNLDKVPADSSEVNFVSYYTAPPRIQVNSAATIPAQGQCGSIEVSMQQDRSKVTPTTPVADQPFKLSAQTPIAGVPECHYSAMRSRLAPSKTPSPQKWPSSPPTPVEGVPELHGSAIAPVAAHHMSSTPSPTPPTEVESPLSALEGVPEAHASAWAPPPRPRMPALLSPQPAPHAPADMNEPQLAPESPSALEGVPEAHASAWAPPPRPRVPTPLSPRQALHETSERNEPHAAPESPILQPRPRAAATASHSFHVPDHPVLLRSNPSPLPLTPRSQLVAESHKAPSPVPAPRELASQPSPEQASRSAASISLNVGSGPGPAPDSVHPASPQPRLHMGTRQVHAATSPMSPMPWFAAAFDPAPAGHVSVAVGTTPAHEGGFGAHTMAGALAPGGRQAAQADAAAGNATQRGQAARSGEGRATRSRSQQSVPRGGYEAASMHTLPDVHGAGQHSSAGRRAQEGSKDAATGSGSVPAAGSDAGNQGSPACVAPWQDAAQPQPDDLWFGPDGDDAMGALDSDDDIPADPCATPPSERRRAAAQAEGERPGGPGDVPVPDLARHRSVADLAGGSSSGHGHDNRITPRLPQGSASAGSQAHGRPSGQGPTPLSTGGMRAVATMLGWDDREANVRDHAMPEHWPQMEGGAGPSSAREDAPSNALSEDADRENSSRGTKARTRQTDKENRPHRVSGLQRRYGKRKSLAESGLAERDGRRYSTRQKMAPLRWYCNEKKEYERKHSSLPTVAVVQRTDQRTSAYAGWKAGHHCDS